MSGMICRIVVVLYSCLFSLSVYSQQKVQDFYLSNYKDNGSRDWEVEGREALVSDEYVEIEEMKAKYFKDDETIDVKSEKATLNKASMDVHLEDNVKVNNQEGMEMSTDRLDWQHEKNEVKTDAPVTVVKDSSLKIEAKGLEANTKMNSVNFMEDVTVDVYGKESQDDETTKISCDGPLEIDYEAGKALFKNNVVVDNAEGKLISERATVYFDSTDSRIVKVVAEGDVKIIRDDNVTFAERAVYFEEGKKIILEGRPRLVIFPEENKDMGVAQ